MNILDELSKVINIDKLSLRHYISSCPRMYKVYSIPKRTTGFRVIAQPTKQLKNIQREIVCFLEKKLPVHASAMAYRESIGIKDNALAHKDNEYILKMDFQNFFNKIKPDLFFTKIKNINLAYTQEDRFVLSNALFWKPGKKRSVTLVLSVGAPSSPFISNFVMYDFDAAMSAWCEDNDITYTRYADDITFSTNIKNSLFVVPRQVKKILAKHSPSITINESKTIFSSKAHNRHITGVTITNDNEISIGRKKKREISALIHKFTLNLLSQDEIKRLKGLLSHSYYIEPSFNSRMVHKYGHDVMMNILKVV